MSAPHTKAKLAEMAMGRGLPGQTDMPGIRAAVTTRDKLDLLAALPMLPRKAQKPCNVGLFDEDRRNQLEMF